MPAKNPVSELIKRELLDRAPYGSYQTRVDLQERFEKRPILATNLDPATIDQAAMRLLTGANKDWVLSGTNAANADSALHADGGVSLATAGADNDQIIVSPAGAINSIGQSPYLVTEWEPDHASRCEFVIELPSLADILVHAGFGLTAVLDLTTDADQAKFQLSDEGAVSTVNWTALDSIGGTDVETDSTRVAEASKSIRLAVEINTLRTARFYVNGILKYTSGALTSGANLIPFVGIQALTGAAKTILVRSIRVSRLMTDA